MDIWIYEKETSGADGIITSNKVADLGKLPCVLPSFQKLGGGNCSMVMPCTRYV